MKKKHMLYVLAPIVCMIGALLYYAAALPKGDTAASREALLDRAIAKGSGWTIAKETEIDGYIISGANSADGKSTIAVFEPHSSGKYRFVTSVNREQGEIVIGGAAINGQWYDLIWFSEAQADYAEIVYTVNGVRGETLNCNTADMELICIPNTETDYSIDVCYYDNEGNKYA